MANPWISRCAKVIDSAPVKVTSLDENHPFTLFTLPLIPRSMISFCEQAFLRLMSTRNLCVAAALIADSTTGQWSMPKMLSQRCGPERTRAVDFSGLSTLPDGLLGLGSVQSVIDDDPADAVANLSCFDGLHGAFVYEGGKPEWIWWLKANDLFTHIPEKHLVIDDWQQSLTAVQNRLHCV